MRRAAPSSTGVFEAEREMLGVAADSSPVSSLSSPKESLLFARAFFFFFFGGPSLFGVEDLFHCHQLRRAEMQMWPFELTRQSHRL